MGYNNPGFGGSFRLLANSCSVQPRGSFGKLIQNKIENRKCLPPDIKREREKRGMKTRQSEKNTTVCWAPGAAVCGETKEITSRVWKAGSLEGPDQRP